MDLLGDFYKQRVNYEQERIESYVKPQTILQDRWRYKKKLNPIDK